MKSTVRSYQLLVTATLVLVGIGMIFYHYVEKFSWLDAYYFCIITLTTIGYGDLTPKTPAGKVFTTFYVLIGIGIITGFITVTARHNAKRIEERREKRRGEK